MPLTTPTCPQCTNCAPMPQALWVLPVALSSIGTIFQRLHYLHRLPPTSYAYMLSDSEIMGRVLGVATFGTPPSRHLMISACASAPDKGLEFNRLWVDDAMPRNTESWFVSRVLRLLPPRVLVSYADTAVGHVGYIYRALNWHYAGLTDADRRTPRFDYVTPGKHSRDTTRNLSMPTAERVRRKPKHRYWTVTGNRRERKNLERIVTWPRLGWKDVTPCR